MDIRGGGDGFGDGGHGLHDGLHTLAEVRIGNAEHGGVEYVRMADEQILDLLRIDVHPAGDDRVRPAVGEVEEPRLPEAHEQAAELLRLARALGREPGLFRLHDLLVEYQLSRPSSALPALESLLDRLEDKPDLYRALRMYLAWDLRRQDAATALHIHPNTLDYRLRRIAELTGIDPTSSHGLQLLAASLIVRAARRNL